MIISQRNPRQPFYFFNAFNLFSLCFWVLEPIICLLTFIIGGCVLATWSNFTFKIKRRVVGEKLVSFLLTSDDSDTATSLSKLLKGACWHKHEELG